jgi:hypothetical protein
MATIHTGDVGKERTPWVLPIELQPSPAAEPATSPKGRGDIRKLDGVSDRRDRQRSSGAILILVLVVVAVLSLSAYTFSSLMVTHHHATKLMGEQLQARLLVNSGVEMVKYYLLQDELSREEMGGHENNPLVFQGVTVLPEVDLRSRGSFSIIAPLPDQTGTGMGSGIRYGLEDESGRLNLNVVLLADQLQAARDLLMGIPGMTEDVADSILDWIDSDEEPRDYGAEADYYASLNPPYAPRNGPLLTVEELLLVRGVTPELLFGLDQNRNTMADAHESQVGTAGGSMTAMATTGFSNHRGWSAYLTLYSAEKNATSEGLPRINLNGTDMQLLHDELVAVFSTEWANFIVAYRLYGAYDGNEQGESAEDLELDLSQQPSGQIAQVLDLIGAKVQVTGGGGAQGGNAEQILESPFQNDPAAMLSYMTALMDNCSISDAATIPGRLNINEAPQDLLFGIPGITEEIVQQIVDQREILADVLATRAHETWLLAEGLVTLEEMKNLLPFVCAGGDVFRTQIVGYYQGGGPSARFEVVFDATEAQPGIVLWRDISHLGRGYALEMLGVELQGGGGF